MGCVKGFRQVARKPKSKEIASPENVVKKPVQPRQKLTKPKDAEADLLVAARKSEAFANLPSGITMIRGRKHERWSKKDFVKNFQNQYYRDVKFPNEELILYLTEKKKLSNRYAKLVLEQVEDYTNSVCDRYTTPPEKGLSKEFQAERPEILCDGKALLALPTEAPEFYKGNRGGSKGGENIVEFLRRVWMPWIEAGVLTRSDLRRLDQKADDGIVNWLQKAPLPDDVFVPTKKVIADQLVGNEFLPRLEAMTERELAALRAIVQRQIHKLGL
jgi:hypothetical protein